MGPRRHPGDWRGISRLRKGKVCVEELAWTWGLQTFFCGSKWALDFGGLGKIKDKNEPQVESNTFKKIIITTVYITFP